MSKREFSVESPKFFHYLIVIALCLVIPMSGIIAVLLLNNAPFSIWLLIAVSLILTAVAGLLILMMRRLEIFIQDDHLIVHATFYKRRIALTDLQLELAEIINLKTNKNLKPGIKTNGFSLPGFYAGHFRARFSGPKLFCLITDLEDVLHIPLNNGSHLLLSPHLPRLVLDELRKFRGTK